MAAPPSQIVASMPRARFAWLMLLFLGPAVAIYSLFSIYPLIATMALSTYTTNQAGAYAFVGLSTFRPCSPTRSGRSRSGTRVSTT